MDLSDVIGKGVFEKLKNEDEFKKVEIVPVTHTIKWSCGIDICPDTIYEEIIGKNIIHKVNIERISVV